MEMQVGNERGPEAVDEDHQPEPRRRTRGCAARPQALLHRAHEQSQRRALERGATVHEVPQLLLLRREHPLAHRHCLTRRRMPPSTATCCAIATRQQ